MSAPFGTPHVLIASTRQTVAGALAKFVRTLIENNLPYELPAENVLTLRHVEELHANLDHRENRTLLNTVCILDLASASPGSRWKLAEDDSPLRPAELVLRYPEVFWIFIVFQKPDIEEAQIRDMHFAEVRELSSLAALLCRHSAGLRTLFDPTCLRRQILGAENSKYGLSLEDEVDYCVFNGYFLYKLGCATYLAPTHAEFEETTKLLETSPREWKWHVIEDEELNYPDVSEDELQSEGLKPREPGNGSLGGRSDQALLNRAWQAIVLFLHHPKDASVPSRDQATTRRPGWTTAPPDQGDSAWERANRVIVSSFLQPVGSHTPIGREWKWRVKPYAGFYDHEIRAVFSRRHDSTRGAEVDREPASAERPHHSAPNKRQEIAAHLLKRCQGSVNDATSTEDAIHVAVLAHVAGELLEHKTPQMALEALAVQHKMEALAECLFIGTSDQLDVKGRLEDLQTSVEAIAKLEDVARNRPSARFREKRWWKRKRQTCNAMLRISSELRNIYRDHERLEEEDFALGKIRKWARLSWVANWANPKGGSWVWWKMALYVVVLALSLPWAYVNIVLRGAAFIGAACFVWIALFAGGYYKVANQMVRIEKPQAHFCWHDWLAHSGETFVGLQQKLEGGIGPESLAAPIERESDDHLKKLGTSRGQLVSKLHRFWEMTVAEMILGYAHVAIFVAWLLQKFSRR